MNPVVTGNTGTPDNPVRSGRVVFLTASDPTLTQGFGPNHEIHWFVMQPVPTGRIVGGIVPFGTTTATLSFTVPLMSGPVRVPVEMRLRDVWTGETATARTDVYLGPADPPPAPTPPPPTPEPPDADIIERTVQFTDGPAVFSAEGKVWDWLAGLGYVVPAPIIGILWTSPHTRAVVEAKAAEYAPPDPDPTPDPGPDGGRYVKLIPARVRRSAGVDTGIYLVAPRDLRADLEFVGAASSRLEVALAANRPWIRNVGSDLGKDDVDLVRVVSEWPVAACAIWQTPTDGPVDFAGFPALDG
jgi:hypothetical protein